MTLDITAIDFFRDRAACEEAIRKAQAELEEAGEEVDEKQSDLALALAWKTLHDAYARLAWVESRTRLARRRVVVQQEREAKAKRG